MEAKKFLERWKRMCREKSNCETCALRETCSLDPMKWDIDTVVSAVERTKKDSLLEKYPRAILMDGGVPKACPKNLDSEYDCSKYSSCLKCREEYWNGETTDL